jgi:hypothetical protein
LAAFDLYLLKPDGPFQTNAVVKLEYAICKLQKEVQRQQALCLRGVVRCMRDSLMGCL